MNNYKAESDLFLRDESDMTSDAFIERYCEVFRPHVYATRDDSLNEFEKLITGVLDTKVSYDTLTAKFGIENVWLSDTLERSDAFVNDETTVTKANGMRHSLDSLERTIQQSLKRGQSDNYIEDKDIPATARAIAFIVLGFSNPPRDLLSEQ